MRKYLLGGELADDKIQVGGGMFAIDRETGVQAVQTDGVERKAVGVGGRVVYADRATSARALDRAASSGGNNPYQLPQRKGSRGGLSSRQRKDSQQEL